MPISKFQSEVLKLIAANRNPDSYIAGGVAINRGKKSLRYSKDVDIFHHAEESVLRSFTHDHDILNASGYKIIVDKKEDSLIRAQISKKGQILRLEWVRDSAFRFFPVVEDPDMGFRLHDVDLATNKCLALAGRNEVRDVLDLVQIHENTLSLTANVWAACGKDPGFSPGLMLNQLSRNSKIYPEDLQSEELSIKVDPVEIKEKWLNMLDTARTQIDVLPPGDLGCIYLDNDAAVKDIDLSKLDTYKKHFGSVLGSWPAVATT